MSDPYNDHLKPSASAAPSADEGGLRAPPGLSFWKKVWWWFDFVFLVNMARLRFIFALLVIGAVITQWDTLLAYWDKWTRPGSAGEVASSEFEWFCPMHPTVVRDNPREKCPVCFMDLAKRRKGSTDDEPLPPGVVNRVQLSPYRIVLAGVQTRPLDYETLSKTLVAAGSVEFNERGQKTVAARVRGRLDQLFVNETGQLVAEGDPLASLYSPELLVTVQNLREGKQAGSAKNEQSARRRLELLGIDDEQIQEILSRDTANTHLTIRSPISGHVIKKYVREGQYVDEGTALYEVADLSTVWIQAQVYEDDIEFLPVYQAPENGRPQQPEPVVTATTRAFPGEPFHGKLTFVYPHVDRDTRTVTVRFEVENPGHKLRPGTTATVNVDVPLATLEMFASGLDDEGRHMLEEGRVLAVPEGAVIDTGAQTIVYRQESPGVFEGVRVRLGPRMSDADGVLFYPVLEGLAPGVRVVVAGSFLVDAETRLNPAAGSIYFGGSGGSQSREGSASRVRPSTPDDDREKIAAALAKLSPADRKLAEAQRYCPVLSQNQLGVMGTPVKVEVDGRTVFLCCKACKKDAQEKPEETLAMLESFKRGASTATPRAAKPADKAEAKIALALARLTPDDRKLAESQRYCAVLDGNRLGSMGPPVKVTIDGQTIFLCCDNCEEDALKDSKATLSNANRLKSKSASGEK